MSRKDVSIYRSNGSGSRGRQYFYIRPILDCFNRSRRCTFDKIDYVIEKYFTPMNYYTVDGRVYGSNSPENAVKEHRRVCAIEDIKKYFEAVLINPA